MNQPYFILEIAHSIHGQFKQIHLTQRTLKYAGFFLLFFGLVFVGLASTCAYMGWQMSRYKTLQADLDHLRRRYLTLQQVSAQRKVQIASLESLASEVSAAYGLNRDPEFAEDAASSSLKESIQQFNYLKAAGYSGLYHRYAHKWQEHTQPSAWPLTGILRSSFGERSDPFSGEGVFHTGVDLSATSGTAVHATADGVVAMAGWSGRYGKLIVVDHGNGVQTYYAHLSDFIVVPGEEVRLGQIIALSGGTGRVTSPHLHYEVRIAGTPVNPYRYLPKVETVVAPRTPHSDLGL